MRKKQEVLNVVFSSHYTDEKNDEFIQHIKKTAGCQTNVILFRNFNEYSLTELYNTGFEFGEVSSNYFVFIHNDIKFRTQDWGKIILRKFKLNKYGIIGVAGTGYLSGNGIWWDEKRSMCGTVEHTDGVNKWVNKYGDDFIGIKDVVLVDGLFMGVDLKNIVTRFDEEFKGFHFYDLSFCINNYLEGVNIGVTNEIRITHESVGQVNKEWEENRLFFIKKFKKYLPIEHEY